MKTEVIGNDKSKYIFIKITFLFTLHIYLFVLFKFIVGNFTEKLLGKENFQFDTELDKKYALTVSQSLENKTNGYFTFHVSLNITTS